MQIGSERNPLRLLDDLTLARLLEVAEGCHADPAVVMAAIVRDVLEDDAREHDREAMVLSLQ